MPELAVQDKGWCATAAAFRVREGDAVTVAVGDVGQVESRRLRDGEGKDFTLRGGGFVAGLQMDAMELAPSSSRRSDVEMPRPFETRSGGRATVNWNG